LSSDLLSADKIPSEVTGRAEPKKRTVKSGWSTDVELGRRGSPITPGVALAERQLLLGGQAVDGPTRDASGGVGIGRVVEVSVLPRLVWTALRSSGSPEKAAVKPARRSSGHRQRRRRPGLRRSQRLAVLHPAEHRPHDEPGLPKAAAATALTPQSRFARRAGQRAEQRSDDVRRWRAPEGSALSLSELRDEGCEHAGYQGR